MRFKRCGNCFALSESERTRGDVAANVQGKTRSTDEHHAKREFICFASSKSALIEQVVKFTSFQQLCHLAIMKLFVVAGLVLLLAGMRTSLQSPARIAAFNDMLVYVFGIGKCKGMAVPSAAALLQQSDACICVSYTGCPRMLLVLCPLTHPRHAMCDCIVLQVPLHQPSRFRTMQK
jgi:hypothetical protein